MLFFNTTYCISVQKTSLSVAAVLLYTSPVFVMIFSRIAFKEQITKKKMIAIFLSVVGCAAVSGIFEISNTTISFSGVGFGICAAVGYALYSIFASKLLKKYNSLTILFYTFCVAGIGGLAIGNPVQILANIAADYTSILAILICSILFNVLPYLFYTKALVDMEASRASIIASIEPVVATLFGVFLFQEAISITNILGIVSVLCAIGILNAKK